MSFDLSTFDSRDEWLAARWGVGASEIATVVGLNRHESPLVLWARKVGTIEPEPDNERMAFGRRIEGVVLDLFTEQTGLRVARPSGLALARSHSTRFAFCSPDGFAHEHGDEWSVPFDRDDVLVWSLGPVEAKSTTLRVDFDDDADETAARWLAQVQWQLYVLGAERGWLAVLDSFRDRVRVEEIERDEQAIAWLVEEATTFWRHVEEHEPPATGEQEDAQRVFARLWRPRGERREIDRELAQRLVDAKRESEQAANRYSAVRGEVLDALRFDDGTSADGATVDGRLVVRYSESFTYDADAIRHDFPDETKPYLVESFDVSSFAKAHAKLAKPYKTVLRARPFVVLGLDDEDDA
jgi:putative phage-type endonuclease